MKDFCYWENEFISPNTLRRTKWLLVKDEKEELVYKFNLTEMGIDHITSFEDLNKLFPPVYFSYNEDRL